MNWVKNAPTPWGGGWPEQRSNCHIPVWSPWQRLSARRDEVCRLGWQPLLSCYMLEGVKNQPSKPDLPACWAKIDLRIKGPLYHSPGQPFIDPAPNLIGDVVWIRLQLGIGQFFCTHYSYYKSRQKPRQNLTKKCKKTCFPLGLLDWFAIWVSEFEHIICGKVGLIVVDDYLIFLMGVTSSCCIEVTITDEVTFNWVVAMCWRALEKGTFMFFL